MRRCEACSQSAEFQCTCASLLCLKCLASHDQNSKGHTFTMLQFDIFQALEQTAKAMDEVLKLNDPQEENADLEAAAREIDEALDQARAALEKKRQVLKAKLRELSSQTKEPTFQAQLAALVAAAREPSAREHSGPLTTLPECSQQPATPLLLVKGKTVHTFNPHTSDICRVMEASDSFPIEGAYCLALDSRLFYCGGRVGSTATAQSRLLCLASGAVECRKDMLTARRQHTVVLLEGVVYVLGGFSGRELIAACERFSLVTQQFTPMGSMQHARGSIGAAVSGGKIYVTGYGRKDDSAVCSCLEVYDSQSNCFSSLPFALPSNSGAIGFTVGDEVAFLRGYCLLTYNPTTRQSDSYPTNPRRYSSPTPALVNGDCIYFVVNSDEECLVASLDWRSKNVQEIKKINEFERSCRTTPYKANPTSQY